MNTPGIKILSGFLLLVGCNATDEPQPDILEDKTLSELYQALNSDLQQPEDSLVQLRHYYSEEGEVDRTQDYYYDHTGKQALVVAKTAEADTLGMSIFKYDQSGKMTQKINFIKQDGFTSWNSSVEYVYNADNLETEIYHLRPPLSKSLRAQKFYNPSNQLLEVRFGTEAYVYDYNDKGLVATEKWILLDAPSQPLNTFFYRYDSLDRLIAKEVHVNADAPQRRDAFQYHYNESGKLKEEREFETRFGYSLKERKEFIYRSN
jgi:hypothetical protein